jgi:hypothetical protein
MALNFSQFNIDQSLFAQNDNIKYSKALKLVKLRFCCALKLVEPTGELRVPRQKGEPVSKGGLLRSTA